MAATSVALSGTTTDPDSCRFFCASEYQIHDCRAYSVSRVTDLINKCYIYTAIQPAAIQPGGTADLYQLMCEKKKKTFDINGSADKNGNSFFF